MRVRHPQNWVSSDTRLPGTGAEIAFESDTQPERKREWERDDIPLQYVKCHRSNAIEEPLLVQ